MENNEDAQVQILPGIDFGAGRAHGVGPRTLPSRYLDLSRVQTEGRSRLKVDGFVPHTQHVNLRRVRQPDWGRARIPERLAGHMWSVKDPGFVGSTGL